MYLQIKEAIKKKHFRHRGKTVVLKPSKTQELGGTAPITDPTPGTRTAYMCKLKNKWI